jgi:hypothetical protein
MKTLMATLAAVAAVTAAAPVAAQPYRDYDRGDRYERGWDRDRGDYTNFDQRRHRIDRRIERAMRSGELTRREGIRLSERLNDIERLQARYRVNGYTRWEVADLDRQLDQLEHRVYAQSRDSDYAYRR